MTIRALVFGSVAWAAALPGPDLSAGDGENCGASLLLPPLPREDLGFGSAVAVDSETLMVSAPGYEGGGTVWVYQADATGWDLTQQLIDVGGSDAEMAVVGDDAFIGTPGANRVFVYRRMSGTWERVQELSPPTGSGFGRALTLDGSRLAVGANMAVFIYERDDNTGEWSYRQTVIPDDSALTSGYGSAVALEGDVLAAGDLFQDGFDNSAGAAYVYRFNAANESWELEQKLTPVSPEDEGRFGHAIALSEGALCVTVPWADTHQTDTGMVVVYEYDSQVEAWFETDRLIADDGTTDDRFGSALDVRGDDLVVIAELDSDMERNGGSAYRYRRESGRWREAAKIMPEDIGEWTRFFSANFASDVEIFEGGIVAGHRKFRGQFPDSGAVWLFARDVICFPATEIHSFEVAHGALLAGDLLSLLEPDDDHVRMRSTLGFASVTQNIIDLRVHATSLEETPESMDFVIEGRLSQPGGLVALRLRNWTNNFLKNFWEYPLGTVERREVVENRWNITATEHVRPGDGAIELSVRPSAVAVFSMAGFEALIDFVRIDVD